jgi:hypothetical protein
VIVENLPYKEYENLKLESHFFNSVNFINYNKHKCDEVQYLTFKDSKVRFGLVVGIKDGVVYAPFSAPFGGFSYSKNSTKHHIFSKAIKALKEYLLLNNFTSIRLSLPPSIYDKHNSSKIITALLMDEFLIDFVDINHSYDLRNFASDYIDKIEYSAKKALKISLSKSLKFTPCVTVEEKTIAYEIIKKNRFQRGFPLKLNLKDVLGTANLTESYFFILSKQDGEPIASAICYEVQNNIVQVIYWGGLAEYGEYKPINFLSFKLFEYFKDIGYQTVDIGPSSDRGVVNFGLSEFKESIGCDKHLKLHFNIKVN